MSALGDRLRALADGFDCMATQYAEGARDACLDAIDLADDYEAAALAESAQGRGPHAAAVLRWAAERIAASEYQMADDADVSRWADEAVR